MTDRSLRKTLPYIIIIAIVLQLALSSGQVPASFTANQDIKGSFIKNLTYNYSITAINNSNKDKTYKIYKTSLLLLFILAIIFSYKGNYHILSLGQSFDIRDVIFSRIPSYFNGSKYKGCTSFE
ncbi:MAG: hypothetical protein ACM3TR_06330 [Caulobacteraceae bacterium]